MQVCWHTLLNEHINFKYFKMNYFDSICRLCLTQTGLYHIFKTQDLLQDIHLCTGISMLYTDPLPQKICEKCFTIVMNAKKLRLIATANDTNLRIFCVNMNNDVQTQKTAEENPKRGNEVNYRIETILVQNEKPTENPCTPNSDDFKLNVVVTNDKPFERGINGDNTGQDSTEPVESPCAEKEKRVCSSSNIVEVESDGIKNMKTGDKTFKCNLCAKYFKTWRQAYLHERVHTKYLKCDICSKWFACKGDLVKHTRVHTGEKPFKCTLCDRSFSQRVTLRQHRKNIHNLKYMNDEVKPCNVVRGNDSAPVPSIT